MYYREKAIELKPLSQAMFYRLYRISFISSITTMCYSDCGSSSESRVLPAVRAPVKSSEPSISSGPHTKEQSSIQTAVETWLEEAHREAGFSKPFTELSVSQQEQLQQRAVYLRQQRDKLLALKKEQQKSKQTTTSEEEPTSQTPAPTTTPINPCTFDYEQLPVSWRKIEIHQAVTARASDEKSGF
ncbi:hypothetical protein F2P81_019822 [Scophthalmus maximus]|uniref:Uncharacterized protein n=1 Tax=Scophthalmus maximus TaxID=52904 RepID=A0A6A4S7K6_SCOMX|nr:hypothetical protein F2P81_019822 [Scophthalmus maximus]